MVLLPAATPLVSPGQVLLEVPPVEPPPTDLPPLELTPPVLVAAPPAEVPPVTAAPPADVALPPLPPGSTDSGLQASEAPSDTLRTATNTYP